MMQAFQRGLDALWGRGEASITIPSMDGALRPNSILDGAPVLLSAPRPDNLAQGADAIFFSSGNSIFALPGAGSQSAGEPRHVFEKPVSCLAAHPSGALVVGTAGALSVRGGRYDGKTFAQIGGTPLLCPTAICFDGPDALLVCLGSQTNPPDEWKRDLMERNRSGSVWRLNLADGAAIRLADSLGFPYGVSAAADGKVIVSESWLHRLVRVKAGARAEPVLSDLPGYPARLAPAPDGGAWLTIFAPRRQMVEFVLRETDYRERMMREVHEDYWMAPTLRGGKSFLEPLQGGAVKHLGIAKPWAPTRSYGLVIRLDAAGSPVASIHSRADGVRHGVTSCLESENRLLVASKGGELIVSVDLAQLDEE
jgi:hypothetical protein